MGVGESSLGYAHFLLLLIIIMACPLVISMTSAAQNNITKTETGSMTVYGADITNTLKQSDTLNSTRYLVSENKNFTLGFVKPFDTTNNTYLAIWNSQYSTPSSPVWIANRDTTITNGSGILMIDNTGKFVINRTDGDPIHLYTRETSTNNTTTSAVLLDNGNLVLREVNSDGSAGRTLWESFDYPSDTLLPGMKLGVNQRTGRNWSLTSWLASDDPSPGAFTLEWDPNGQELVLRRRGVVFWTSGVLKNDYFEQMGGDNSLTQYYHMMSAKTSDEEFFSYSLKNDPMDPKVHTSITWRIDYTGTFFFEDIGIPLQDRCSGYNTDTGCAKWTQPQCRSYNTTFELLSGYFVKADGDADPGYYKGSIGPADCRVSCWNDCDCQAYLNSKTVGCFTHRQEVKFLPDPSGSSRQYYVIQRPQNDRKRKEINKWIWIAISVSVTLLFIVSIFCLRWKRKGKVLKGREEDHLLQLMTPANTLHNANELGYDNNFAQNLKIFSFVSIVEATDNFSAQNKLGEGGFGPVYKGKLPEGIEIAVKKLSRRSEQGLVEFKNELILIAKLQHMNLVRLLGCSIQAEEMMLVYEYLPNKSLDSFLFDAHKRGMLDWRIRVMIIEGISQGLLYLHQHSRLKIIHRDLKASNILLDADMNPKISDFGMARIFKRNEFIANTNRIVGTYGYMSPEYAMEGIFSIKSDVFSFGVLLLEILSGKRNNSFYNVNGPLNLVGYAWDLWEKGVGLELMDPLLRDSCSTQQFLRFIQVGLLCVEESPADRPTIAEVISMPTNESTHLPAVKKPAFTNLDNVTNADSQGNDIEYHSVNKMSISTMDGR